MPILIPILVLLAVGVLCGLLLTFASVFFDVKGDKKAAAIRETLPGANCGSCGFSGCDAYAKALANGETAETNLCTPGGDGTARDIAAVLGVEALDVVEKVAYVACNGYCPIDHNDKKYDYNGPKTCKAANMSFGGDKFCTFACLGYGDCVAVCPKDAICITDDGVARVNPRRCIGCGVCVKTCPNGIIGLINDTSRIVVSCNNHYKGADVRRYCTNGCIACGKCEKTCPHDAIKVIDNLATIDYEKCTGCGACKEVCPVHCIHEGNFICGAHFE